MTTQQGLKLRYTGREVNAEYLVPMFEEERGNPFSEALPERLPDKNAILNYLTVRPQITDRDRSLPPELRMDRANRLRYFLIPDDHHVEVFRIVNRLIRDSYLGRNPARPININERNAKVQEAVERITKGLEIDMADLAASIFGLSRIGKSLATFRSLDYFPQIINHSFYGGKKFSRRQLVWLHQDCVFDGRPNGMLKMTYELIDALLHTNYKHEFTRAGNKDADAMLGGFFKTLPNVGIGLWVLDEMQVLYNIQVGIRRLKKPAPSQEKSKLADQLINLLVTLSDFFGVGLLFIGTPPAAYVLGSKFRFLCRASAEGRIDWTCMDPKSQEWKNFVHAIASLHLVRKPINPDAISDILYQCSAGIAGVAIMVMIAAQRYAIDKGTECVTKKEIEAVFRKNFSAFEDPIRQVIDGHPKAADVWEDLFFRADYVKKAHQVPDPPRTSSSPSSPSSAAEAPITETDITTSRKTREVSTTPSLAPAPAASIPSSYEEFRETGLILSPSEILGH